MGTKISPCVVTGVGRPTDGEGTGSDTGGPGGWIGEGSTGFEVAVEVTGLGSILDSSDGEGTGSETDGFGGGRGEGSIGLAVVEEVTGL